MDICRFYPVGVFQRTAVVLDGDPLLTFGTPAGRNAMDGQGLRQVGGGGPFFRGSRSRFGLYGFLSAASCSGSGGVSVLLFADSAVRPAHRKRHEKRSMPSGRAIRRPAGKHRLAAEEIPEQRHCEKEPGF